MRQSLSLVNRALTLRVTFKYTYSPFEGEDKGDFCQIFIILVFIKDKNGPYRSGTKFMAALKIEWEQKNLRILKQAGRKEI